MDLLLRALREGHERQGSSHDFGRDVLPRLIDAEGVYVYRFGGEAGRVSPDRYWRDVGTLDSNYQANMDLLRPELPLDLYQPDWPIRTYQAQYPPTRTVPGYFGSEGIFINSVAGGSVQQSILFPEVRIADEASSTTPSCSTGCGWARR